MDWLTNLVFPGGDFLGIEWTTWKVVGWTGNAVFFSRFIVQWYATEKRKQVVVPVSFWWLSLAGTVILLTYATFYRRDSVFIFAYLFAWIPYLRNLIIHSRHEGAHIRCPDCDHLCIPGSRFCNLCGAQLATAAGAPSGQAGPSDLTRLAGRQP